MPLHDHHPVAGAFLLGFSLVSLGCGRDIPVQGIDGSGQALIEPDTPVVVASTGAWTIRYRAPEAGLAPGSGVVFRLPLYWEWTPPQMVMPNRPGFVRATLEGEKPIADIIVHPGIHVVQVPLEDGMKPGQELALEYGTADSPVRADSFSEDTQAFIVEVDGDGDGQHAQIANSPTLRMLARPAIQTAATVVPSLVAPQDSLRLTIAALDGFDNLDGTYEGTWRVTLWKFDTERVTEGTLAGEEILVAASEQGTGIWHGEAPDAPGRYRYRVENAEFQESAWTEPFTIRTRPGSRKLIWADLHGHSSLTDGTGSADDYHFYARRVSGLDAACLTDHDHHGMAPLDSAAWEHQTTVAQRHHRPGDYVTLMGYEYTNWVSGHRNVYFKDLSGQVYAASDSATDTPEELWAHLDPELALTVPHHTAGEPVRVDWTHHDPLLEPIVEIASVHGVSEAIGVPDAVRGATPENTVRAALDRGYLLGFIASGDGHVGHPGRQLKPFPWGLCGLWVDRHDRAGIFDALRRRSAFGTNGPRIIVRFSAGGTPMGGQLTLPFPEEITFVGEVIGTSTLQSVEILKNGEVWAARAPDGEAHSMRFEVRDTVPPRDGDYYYLRVRQSDGGTAWSSPVWARASSLSRAP